MLLPVPALIASVVLTQFVRVSITKSRLNLPDPKSGGYRQITLVESGPGSGFGRLERLELVLTPLTGSQDWGMQINPHTLAYHYVDATGRTVDHGAPLDSAGLLQWMRDLGVHADADALSAEVEDVLRRIKEDVRAGTVRNGTVGAEYFRIAALDMSGSGYTTPAWFIGADVSFWLIFWIAVLWRILRPPGANGKVTLMEAAAAP
ncbi:MAG TPA: hypothetical protein VGM03_11935 [Phycisphaerae bacterium]